MSTCRDGVPIQFAARFVGVSNAAAIVMQKTIRSAMQGCQKEERIGGPGRTVHAGLFRLRVRRPEGHSRSTQRTVVLGFDGERFSAAVLRQRSSRYVMLWAKRHIAAGSEVHQPGGPAFALLSSVANVAVSRNKRGRKHSPCTGAMAGLKRHLIRHHTRVPYERLESYLKALEFKRFHGAKDFSVLLRAIAYAERVAI